MVLQSSKTKDLISLGYSWYCSVCPREVTYHTMDRLERAELRAFSLTSKFTGMRQNCCTACLHFALSERAVLDSSILTTLWVSVPLLSFDF